MPGAQQPALTVCDIGLCHHQASIRTNSSPACFGVSLGAGQVRFPKNRFPHHIRDSESAPGATPHDGALDSNRPSGLSGYREKMKTRSQ